MPSRSRDLWVLPHCFELLLTRRMNDREPPPQGTGLEAYKSKFYLDTDNQSSVAQSDFRPLDVVHGYTCHTEHTGYSDRSGEIRRV